MRASARDKKRGTWSEEFRQFRRKFMYSQRELAGMLGISKRSVTSIETGFVRMPRRETQRKFHALRYKFEQERLLEQAERAARERAIKAKGRRKLVPVHLFRKESMTVKLEA